MKEIRFTFLRTQESWKKLQRWSQLRLERYSLKSDLLLSQGRGAPTFLSMLASEGLLASFPARQRWMAVIIVESCNKVFHAFRIIWEPQRHLSTMPWCWFKLFSELMQNAVNHKSLWDRIGIIFSPGKGRVQKKNCEKAVRLTAWVDPPPPPPPPKRSGKCKIFSTSCHIWGYFAIL